MKNRASHFGSIKAWENKTVPSYLHQYFEKTRLDNLIMLDQITLLQEMRQYYNQMEENNTSTSQTESQSVTVDGPWTATSSSAVDIYPFHLDSS